MLQLLAVLGLICGLSHGVERPAASRSMDSQFLPLCRLWFASRPRINAFELGYGSGVSDQEAQRQWYAFADENGALTVLLSGNLSANVLAKLNEFRSDDGELWQATISPFQGLSLIVIRTGYQQPSRPVILRYPVDPQFVIHRVLGDFARLGILYLACVEEFFLE